MAAAEDYARWITANQDKIGTPEFQTVAAAYQQAKSTGPDKQALLQQAQADDEAFRASVNPTEGMSGMEKFRAGWGKFVADSGRGIGQLLGVTDQQSIDDAKRRDEALMDTGAGMAGNLAGGIVSMAPTALIPGANTLAGSALLGTASGALEPVASNESRLAKALWGLGGAVGGDMAARGISRALNPRTPANVRMLMEEGVTPTPGGILGGIPQKMESAMESWPIAGQAITGAKAAVTEEFNEAAINRALSPIGKRITAIGHEGMRQAREAIEDSYDDALNLLPTVQIDPQFAMALSRTQQAAQGLIPDRANQLQKIIQDEVSSRIGGSQQITGEMLHTIESQIKAKARKLSSTPGYDEQQMGQALNDLVGEIRALAGRNSPDAAEALKKADTAYAMLLRLENAASGQGAPQGVFTPTQLGSSIRNMDRSLRKVDIAQGEGLMQDLTTAGRDVLGGSLPNSGTTDRALMAALLSGRGSLKDVAGLVATGGIYSDPGRKLLATALARRPESFRAAGHLVRSIKPAAAIGGAQLANE